MNEGNDRETERDWKTVERKVCSWFGEGVLDLQVVVQISAKENVKGRIFIK